MQDRAVIEIQIAAQLRLGRRVKTGERLVKDQKLWRHGHHGHQA